MSRVSPGFDNKVVGVIPVGEQVSCILIVHTDVVIGKHPWEEVVNLSGNIQNVTDSATKTNKALVFASLLRSNMKMFFSIIACAAQIISVLINSIQSEVRHKSA